MIVRIIGLAFWPIIAAISLFGSRSMEHREKPLHDAARQVEHDPDEVARVYWMIYSETNRRKSQWIILNRYEKSAIYAERERLRDLFSQFPAQTASL